MSVAALAAVPWKIWQYRSAGVGGRGTTEMALAAWDAGRAADVDRALMSGPAYLRSVLAAALAAPEGREASERIEAMTESALARIRAPQTARTQDFVARIRHGG
jgi:biopolymer transport protein ExbB